MTLLVILSLALLSLLTIGTLFAVVAVFQHIQWHIARGDRVTRIPDTDRAQGDRP